MYKFQTQICYYFLNKLKDLIESKNGIFNFIEKTEIKNIIKFDKPTNQLYELISFEFIINS